MVTLFRCSAGAVTFRPAAKVKKKSQGDGSAKLAEHSEILFYSSSKKTFWRKFVTIQTDDLESRSLPPSSPKAPKTQRARGLGGGEGRDKIFRKNCQNTPKIFCEQRYTDLLSRVCDKKNPPPCRKIRGGLFGKNCWGFFFPDSIENGGFFSQTPTAANLSVWEKNPPNWGFFFPDRQIKKTPHLGGFYPRHPV